MKYRISAGVASLLLCCGSPGVPVEGELRDELVGHWSGHLERSDRRYPIRIDVFERGASVAATVDLPQYCIYGADAEVRVRAGEITFEAARIELTASLSGASLVGHAAGFQDVRATLEVERRSDDPVTYRREEVEFEGAGARLAGTLVFPSGPGPFALIVWTHGSGRDTRSTFYYAGRAHLLAQNGVASLIYDKRGAGQSTGSDAWSVDLLAQDAVRAARFAAQHADVDTDAIGIAGFSQGGWVAPLAASLEPEIDFIVVGATPGISAAEQNIFSAASRLRRDGYGEEDVDAARDLLRRLYDFYASGENREEVVEALRQAEGERWFSSRWVSNVTFLSATDGLREGIWRSWGPTERDPVATWEQIRIPVLSVWGAEDIDVPAEHSRARIEAALEAAGNTDYELVVFPRASHGLWDERERAGWDWPRQVMEAHALIVEWVVEHTR